MPATLDISAGIPAQTVDNFISACTRYQTELGNSQATAIRRGTIALVKSLRARTAKSKKLAPASHVTRSSNPKWLTPKGHNQTAQRAWAIRRRVGSDREKTYIHTAESKAEARAKFAKYTRWGLARQSWGWFMHALFNRSAPNEGNPKVKIDDRMTDGYLREIVTGSNPRVEVLIHNKLSYIRDALPAGALDESLNAATNYINKNIDAGLAKARQELDK